MKPTFLPLVIIFGFISCKDDDHGPGSPLKGCCGNEAIDTDLGNGHIYVPNIFTPNADGHNDVLGVCGISIDLLVEFEIRDKSGKVVFEIFGAEVCDFSKGWDGKVDGEVVEGVFDVLISVLAEDGTSHTVEGKVCNFPCDGENVTERVPYGNCQFPAQLTNGYYCPTCPSGEGGECYE